MVLGNSEFKEVKKLPTQAPIILYYTPDKKLVMQCDGSKLALSVALI